MRINLMGLCMAAFWVFLPSPIYAGAVMTKFRFHMYMVIAVSALIVGPKCASGGTMLTTHLQVFNAKFF